MVAPASRTDQVRSLATLRDPSHACIFDDLRLADSDENGGVREEEDSVVEFGYLEGELVLLAYWSVDNHCWSFCSVADEGRLLSAFRKLDASMLVTRVKKGHLIFDGFNGLVDMLFE